LNVFSVEPPKGCFFTLSQYIRLQRHPRLASYLEANCYAEIEIIGC
jgi:hypothetical protein